MERNFSLLKFIKQKSFWTVILIVFLVLVTYVYFSSRGPDTSEPTPTASIDGDITPPSTAVISPKNKSWHNKDFLVTVRDVDLDSGLAEFIPGTQGCKYIVEDLGTGLAIGDFRECGEDEILVSIGEEGFCSSSYQADSSQGSCKVSTKAFDRAGNESVWKSRIFHIDIRKPKVSSIFPDTILPGQEYLFEATVSDNSKIAGCRLFLNQKLIDTTVKIEPIPCTNENLCTISTKYSFQDPGEYEAVFTCVDSAGNAGYGDSATLTVFVNHPPQITSCRVIPAQGIQGQKFVFQVEASDPDKDELFYEWNFGDNNYSDAKFPLHAYDFQGTYMPKVTVEDSSGESATCSTAWVVVEGQ